MLPLTQLELLTLQVLQVAQHIVLVDEVPLQFGSLLVGESLLPVRHDISDVLIFSNEIVLLLHSAMLHGGRLLELPSDLVLGLLELILNGRMTPFKAVHALLVRIDTRIVLERQDAWYGLLSSETVRLLAAALLVRLRSEHMRRYRSLRRAGAHLRSGHGLPLGFFIHAKD